MPSSLRLQQNGNRSQSCPKLSLANSVPSAGRICHWRQASINAALHPMDASGCVRGALVQRGACLPQAGVAREKAAAGGKYAMKEAEVK